MSKRTIILELDEADYDEIQDEIAFRQRLDNQCCGKTTIIGDSNLAGFLIAECIRDLDEYRSMFDSMYINEEDDEGDDSGQ